jgi:glycosyltransferase involved in cell wall biosynthesis
LQELIASHDLTDRVTHLTRISDKDLTTLYNGADCFVLPSTYEGFGLPLIEAMACGCPVVVFRNSSLAEIGGDAVRYPETEDEKGLIEAFRDVLGSSSLRDDLSARGLKRAAQFSWSNTAQQTLSALEEAANG